MFGIVLIVLYEWDLLITYANILDSVDDSSGTAVVSVRKCNTVQVKYVRFAWIRCYICQHICFVGIWSIFSMHLLHHLLLLWRNIKFLFTIVSYTSRAVCCTIACCIFSDTLLLWIFVNIHWNTFLSLLYGQVPNDLNFCPVNGKLSIVLQF